MHAPLAFRKARRGLSCSVPANYLGDGRAELAVFVPSTAGHDNADVRVHYLGDGHAEMAVFRPSTGGGTCAAWSP